ncbi:MAG: hypothetical protein ABIK91_11545 [Pseudomonadota bacterium]|nr:hypothetical protein [Pseudomonadota bacterium]
MNDIQTADTIAAAFITRWELSGGKELANYQSFLIEGAEKRSSSSMTRPFIFRQAR